MARKPKYNKEINLKAIKEYLNETKTFFILMEELDVSETAIRKWLRNYREFGEVAFDIKQRNNTYTKELKLAAIKEYLDGNGQYLI